MTFFTASTFWGKKGKKEKKGSLVSCVKCTHLK